VAELKDEAARSNRFVSLHVEEDNPARRLYQRLGFRDAGEVTFYKLMHWVPEGHTPVFADGGG
jgi:predicted GNAT family acetyltransferase